MVFNKKIIAGALIALAICGIGYGAATRTIEADAIRSSDRSKTWTMPGSTGTLARTADNVATATALAADPTDCSSNQFANAIAASGNLTCAQPAFSNLSGSVSASQMPALTGDVTTSAGAVATTLATVNSNVGSFTNASITVNAKGLITAASTGTGASYARVRAAHAGSNCSWARTSSSFGDPSIDSSCTFSASDSSGLGSVVSANDGTPGNNLPGITITPASSSDCYNIVFRGLFNIAASAISVEYRLLDDASAVFDDYTETVPSGATGRRRVILSTGPVCPGTTSAKTYRVQWRNSDNSATVTLEGVNSGEADYFGVYKI